MTHLHAAICVALLTFSGYEVHEVAGAPAQRRASNRARRTSISADLAKLLNDLRGLGADVKLVRETTSQPFFSARGRIIQLNAESVWVFEYSSSAAAEKDARKVSLDGMTIGNAKASWLNTPHFFRRPRTIVLYLGNDPRILDSLTRAVGQQFAGG